MIHLKRTQQSMTIGGVHANVNFSYEEEYPPMGEEVEGWSQQQARKPPPKKILGGYGGCWTGRTTPSCLQQEQISVLQKGWKTSPLSQTSLQSSSHQASTAKEHEVM
ncbi:hypothetical protein DPEC_G00245470 [Dallia pectoralis]|uniref:Uncharacterized protein n=1 Tax=Dallia pectoralis TaxID=75939 RepID=A0ACC2FVT8_DALPE|nr:hypothetical protein DPEC_G00245470 [Dallia pectoralis]